MSTFTQTGSAKVVEGEVIRSSHNTKRKKKKDYSKVMLPEDVKVMESDRSDAEKRAELNRINAESAAREKQRQEEYNKQLAAEEAAKSVTEIKDLGEAVTTYKLPDGTTTTIKPSPVTGWRVMLETINITFNPFSDKEGGIVATMGGKTFRSVAEFVANHPYTTALIIATGATGLTALTGKFAVGTVAEYASVGGYTTNTATIALTGNLLVKSGFSLIAAATIAATVGGTYPFAKFEIVEAMDKLGIARWKAYEKGDKETMEALDALQDEILNPVGWEKILRNLPFTNVYTAVVRNIQAAEASREVFNKLLENEQIAKDNGESEDEKWERVRQQELDQEKEAIDYYNSERKKQLLWENELYRKQQEADTEIYEESRKEQRKLDKKAREKEAEFWRKERAKQRELEAADRKAIAEFWLAYKKQSQRLADEGRPSQLNFGLL